MADIENVINAMEHCKKYGTLGGHDCSGLFEYTIDLRSIIRTGHEDLLGAGQLRLFRVLAHRHETGRGALLFDAEDELEQVQ